MVGRSIISLQQIAMPPRRSKIQKPENSKCSILAPCSCRLLSIDDWAVLEQIKQLEEKRDAQRVKIEIKKASGLKSGLATLERNLVTIEDNIKTAKARLNDNIGKGRSTALLKELQNLKTSQKSGRP